MDIVWRASMGREDSGMVVLVVAVCLDLYDGCFFCWIAVEVAVVSILPTFVVLVRAVDVENAGTGIEVTVE